MKREHEDEEEHRVQSFQNIVCNLPPCDVNPRSFADYGTYEHHIITYHDYICKECHRRFPSKMFLDIHIDENHNPFMAIRQQNGDKIFKCFVLGCSKVCSSPKKRRLHMIDKHNYPRSFNWRIVNDGI